MSRSDEGHDLLPFYLNGTLSPAESRAFESHLTECESCHGDMRELAGLQRQIEASGEALFEDHLDAGTIAATALELEVDPERTRSVRRHLGVCGPCSLELRWAQGRPAAPVRSSSRQRTRRRGGRRRWAAAAASAVIAAVSTAIWLAPARPASRSLDAYLLDSSVRADGLETVDPAPGAEGFGLILQVDVAPEEQPLEVLVRGEGGKIVLSEVHERPLLQGMFLVLYCVASSFPDGDYTVQVRPGSVPTRTMEYRFRVRRRS